MKKRRFDVRHGISYDIKCWFRENGIRSYSWYRNRMDDEYISFKYAEDAIAFKLQWL